MLSRVADSLYWMSRYMERTDGILRMLKINYASSQDAMDDFSWMQVLRIFTFLSEEKATALQYDSRAVINYMVLNKDNTNSVLNIVTNARENGRSVQDHITKEMWQCLNDFYHTLRDPELETQLAKDDPITVLDGLLKKGLLYFGTTDVTMSRGESNAFINIGKFLERAIQSTDVLDIKFSQLGYQMDYLADATYWKYLLMSISGYELYIKTYRSGFDARNIVEQVLHNHQFPRSVIYAVERVLRYFARIKNEGNIDGFKEIEFMMGKLQSKIKYSTIGNIADEGLHDFLQEIKMDLYNIGNALSRRYFAYG